MKFIKKCKKTQCQFIVNLKKSVPVYLIVIQTPRGTSISLKTNYTINLNNFSTKTPIFGHKISLNRPHLDLKHIKFSKPLDPNHPVAKESQN